MVRLCLSNLFEYEYLILLLLSYPVLCNIKAPIICFSTWNNALYTVPTSDHHDRFRIYACNLQKCKHIQYIHICKRTITVFSESINIFNYYTDRSYLNRAVQSWCIFECIKHCRTICTSTIGYGDKRIPHIQKFLGKNASKGACAFALVNIHVLFHFFFKREVHMNTRIRNEPGHRW